MLPPPIYRTTPYRSSNSGGYLTAAGLRWCDESSELQRHCAGAPAEGLNL